MHRHGANPQTDPNDPCGMFCERKEDMRLRPYIHAADFEAVKDWIDDERIHAMWCAGHMKFPLEKDDFENALTKFHMNMGDCPFLAVDDGGKPVGFLCISIDYESNEAMLAFVMLDPAQRGKGYGKEMIQLAAKYCFEILKADSVQLNVFSANTPARRCYAAAGLTERKITEKAFSYNDEQWDRINMVIKK